MATAECKAELKKAYSELDEKDLDKIADEIDQIQIAFKDDKSLMNKAVKEYVDAHQADLKYSSLTFIRNKIKEQRLHNFIIDSSSNFGEANKKLKALYLGNNSIESSQRSRANLYTNQLMGKLKENGVEKQFFSGEYDRAVREHAFNIGKGLAGSEDPNVVKIFDSIKAVNDSIYTDWHLAGLNIKYRKDFINSIRYDIGKLISGGKDNFVEMAMKTLDKNETFSATTIATGDEGMRKVLEEMYDDMIDSKSAYVIQDDMNKNFLRKLKSRKLEFATAEAQQSFMEAFAKQESLSESMYKQMDISAKNVEVTHALGTNFDKSFGNLASAIKKEFLKKDTAGMSAEEVSKYINQMDRKLRGIEAAHKQLTSPPYVPSGMVDTAIAFLKNLNTFSKLGSSFFANLYDLNSSALQYTLATGESQAIGMYKAIQNVLGTAFDKAKRQELAELLNIQAHFIDYSIVMGGSGRDLTTGFKRFDKMFSMGYKATGVPYLTELNKLNNAINMSYAFEKMTRIGYNNLDPLLKANADMYKFTQADFDYIQKFVAPDKKYGIISPTDIIGVELEHVMKHYNIDNPIKAAKMRDDLFKRYSNFIDDTVHKGSPMSTTAEKLELGRLSQDPLLRTVSSIATQFKETPYRIAKNNIEAYNRIKSAYGGARAGGEVFMYATMGMTSFMAFESLRRLVLGQESILDQMRSGDKDSVRRLVMDYANRSAIMPILTDVADAATSPNRTANIGSYLMGPTVAMANDAGNVIKSLGSETEGSTTTASKKFLGRHVLPNHFLIKGGMRKMFDIDMTTLQKIRE